MTNEFASDDGLVFGLSMMALVVTSLIVWLSGRSGDLQQKSGRFAHGREDGQPTSAVNDRHKPRSSAA